MLARRPSLLDLLMVSVALPCGLACIAYLGFAPGTPGAYSREIFLLRFRHGIYALRPLGTAMVEAWMRICEPLLPGDLGGKKMNVFACLDPNFSWSFYTCLVLFSAAWFCATMLALRWARDARGEVERDDVLALLAVFASLYMVTPYDLPSYAVMLLTWGALLRAERERRWLALALALMVVGTAIRESQALVVAAYVARQLARQPGMPLYARVRQRHFLVAALGATLAFLATYAALRVSAGDVRIIKGLTIARLSLPATLLGLGLGLAFLLLAVERRRRFAGWFALATLPYSIAIVVGANLFELRLFVPLLLLTLVQPLETDQPPAAATD